MSRTIQDANLIKTKALPAAAATAYTDPISLAVDAPFPSNELFEVKVSVPATAALVEAKTITLGFQDSANDSSWANIAGTGTLVITGGPAALALRVAWLSRCRQWSANSFRAYATVLTGGGDNTGVSFTFELLFLMSLAANMLTRGLGLCSPD